MFSFLDFGVSKQIQEIENLIPEKEIEESRHRLNTQHKEEARLGQAKKAVQLAKELCEIEEEAERLARTTPKFLTNLRRMTLKLSL